MTQLNSYCPMCDATHENNTNCQRNDEPWSNQQEDNYE